METKFKIHAWYILSILITIIVVLVSVKWDGVPNLVSILSFALTITSLVLSGIAIIYAFISNGAFQGTIQSLNKTSEVMSKSGERIGAVVATFEEKLDNIPTMIKEVDGKVSKTHEMVESFSKRPSNSAPIAVTEIKDQTAAELVDHVIKRFAYYSSMSGLKITYAFGLSFLNAHPLNLRELCQKLGYVEYSYAHGFAVAMVGVGLIDYDQNDKVFEVTHLTNDLFGAVEGELKVRREGMEQEERNEFDADIQTVKDYFAGSPLDTGSPRPAATELSKG